MPEKKEYSGPTNIAAINAFLAVAEGLSSDQKEQVRKMLKAFVLAGAVGSLIIFYYKIKIKSDRDGATTITAEKTE